MPFPGLGMAVSQYTYQVTLKKNSVLPGTFDECAIGIHPQEHVWLGDAV